MTKDEALKMALEALEYFSDTATLNMDKAMSEDAITAIKEALAQPEQEPVAWMYEVNNAHTCLDLFEPPDDAYDEGTLHPLYTTSPQRNPLTRKEVLAIIDKHPAEKKTGLPMFYRDQVLDIARAIEAAHGIKV